MIIDLSQLIQVPLGEAEIFRITDNIDVPIPIIFENNHLTNSITLKLQHSATGASGSFVDEAANFPAFTLTPAGSPGSVAEVTLKGLDQFVRYLGSGGQDGSVGKELSASLKRRKEFNGSLTVLVV